MLTSPLAAAVKFSSVLLSSRTWVAEKLTVTPTAVPINSEYLKISIDVTDMTLPESKIEINLEISFDGGKNWKNLGIAIFSGGKPSARAGMPPYVSNMEQFLPDTNNPECQVRVFVEVKG